MTCPACGARVDPDATEVCPRCGAALGASEGLATERLGTSGATPDGTVEITGRSSAEPTSGRPTDGPPGRGGRRAATARVAASLRAGGWPEAAAAAAIAFAGVLCVGAGLLVAAKLDVPSIGAGADPVDVLTWIVILSLGSLGAPIEAGRLEVALLPMGALVVAGLIIARVTRAGHEKRAIDAGQERALEGAKVGVPFALLCFVAAVVFRYATGNEVVGADAPASLLYGLLWGSLFGALGALWADRRLPDIARRAVERIGVRSRSLYDAIVAGGAMTIAALVMAAAVVLLWAIVGLATGAPGPRFGAGDAVASLIYLIAFLPNVLVTVIALSLGAEIDAGAGLLVDGRIARGVEGYSLTDWGGGDAPAILWLLVMVPLLAGAIGGVVGRRRAPDGSIWHVLPPAAALFAVTLGVAANLADARLGAGLVRERGFALVAPDASDVLLLALFWGVCGGIVGWKLPEVRRLVRRSGAPP